MSTPKLSEKANRLVENLQQQISMVINADRVREPKLNDPEKQEIIQLEATIAKYTPWADRLLAQLQEAEARLQYLNSNYKDLVFEEKETARELASEFVSLPKLIEVLFDARRAAAFFVSSSELRIASIKDKARDREVREGEVA